MPSATILWMPTRSWGRSAPAASIWGFSDHCVTEMAKTFRGQGTAVAPTECNVPLGQSDQSVVGNGDTMSVGAEIAQHMFGPTERPFGVDVPSRDGESN